MGHRLSRIYTRTGDKGTTGLGEGRRVDKDCRRVEVIGDVDELNSTIGLVLYHDIRPSIDGALAAVQHRLFDLGGELSMPGYTALTPEHVETVERQLDAFNEELPPLKEFILPGGGPGASACHLARAVCRRAERHLVSLSREEEVNPSALAYLNRLSDLLFVLSRVLARDEGGVEVLWRNELERDRRR